MKKDYTHITVILDRTGSMESIRDDTIGGFNAFLDEQKNEPGKATMTLVQFDSQDPYEVLHRFKKIKKIPHLTRESYVPRASTPLLDAVGRGINDLESSLSDIKEEEKPARIVVVIITDGHENSSREFRKDQIEKMIKEKQEKYDWQFVFLSADLDAIEDAMESGFHARSSMAFDKSAAGISNAFASTSKKISEYRMHKSMRMEFDEEDRAKQESEKKRKKS